MKLSYHLFKYKVKQKYTKDNGKMMFKSGSKISAINENSHDLCPFFRFRAARFPWNSSTKAWMHADSKSFAGCSEETSVWVEDVQLKTDMIEIPGKKTESVRVESQVD